MVNYVGNNKSVSHEHHWIPVTDHCGLCEIDWILLLHQEEAKTEYGWLTNSWLNVGNKTHFGSEYTHQEANDVPWNQLTKNQILNLYRFYYLDFILLGYSVSDVEAFMDLGSD